jgi:hypothetical protein
MRPSRGRHGIVTAVCFAALAAALLAVPAQAATTVYPAGAGTFTGGPQGWVTTEANCNVAVLCTADGSYDGADGSPAGSYAANTTIALNVTSVFKSTIAFQSPDFTVAAAGDGTLHLERQFVPGALVDQKPEVTYTVDILDRTSNRKTEALTETITAASPFTGKDAAVTVKAGHTYAISITAVTSSTVAGTGLLAGATALRFDNVALSVAAGGESGGGSGAAGTLTNQQLQSLISGNASLIGPAILKGSRLSVKVRCPAKVGRTCRITLQGLLKKHRPATAPRKANIRKGKTKRVVLKVKPKALAKVRAKKKLLFKETVRAGKARATVYKQLKLIRR